MKKLVAIALLLCTVFSMSSFMPSTKPATVLKKEKRFFSFPITGTIDGAYLGSPATYQYTINGSGTTPTTVTITVISPVSATVGTYPFTGSNPQYFATGMGSATNNTIKTIIFTVTSSTSQGYNIDIIGLN